MKPEDVLAAVFGPLQWTATGVAMSHAAYTSYRGLPLQLSRSYNRRGYYSTSLRLRLSHPFALQVFPARGNYRREYEPLVDTGDPIFHATFRLLGSPPELIARALDPTLRQRMLETQIYPGTLDRVLEVNISTGVEGAQETTNIQGVQTGWVGEGDPAVARAQVELFVDLVLGIQQQFDQTYRWIEAAQGTGAAQAWFAEQVAALGQAQRSKLKAIALTMIPAVVLVLALIAWLLFH
jgi:hypothetical protein